MVSRTGNTQVHYKKIIRFDESAMMKSRESNGQPAFNC